MVRMRGCCRCGEERRDDGRTFWCDTSANKGEGDKAVVAFVAETVLKLLVLVETALVVNPEFVVVDVYHEGRETSQSV